MNRTNIINIGLCSVLFSLLCSNRKLQFQQRPFDVEPIINDTFPAKENETYVISRDIDLHGKCYVLPANVTLKFNGGKIKDGTLVGNNTQIDGTKKIFDKVIIKGIWNVKEISTEMFVNANDTNALKNVIALSNSQINNIIYVAKGKYILKVGKKDHIALKIPSNTKLIVEGKIYLLANNLKTYSIIKVSDCRNVSIEGKGCIVGDRQYHIGKDGQWGMGISLNNVKNVKINGLTIKDAWGDGIYVGKKSENVIIDGCHIDNCRRQGISVIGGNDVRITNCEIKNIHGTAPEYAIDIEPNLRDTMVGVVIDNVIVQDCVGGFKSYSSPKRESYISNVRITNCRVFRCKKIPFNIMGANNVVLDSNYVYNCSSKKIYFFRKSKNVKVNKKEVIVRNDIWDLSSI